MSSRKSGPGGNVGTFMSGGRSSDLGMSSAPPETLRDTVERHKAIMLDGVRDRLLLAAAAERRGDVPPPPPPRAYHVKPKARRRRKTHRVRRMK